MEIFEIILGILLISYVIKKRNQFNTLRRNVQHQAANIGIHIEKRSQCLNDAMNIAKINYRQEVEGVEKLTINDQLEKLAYLGQKYPSLQSTSNYNLIVQQAFELNKDISASRELVNGNINIYNDAISMFPGLLIALIFGYKKEKFIDEENIENNKMLERTEFSFDKF